MKYISFLAIALMIIAFGCKPRPEVTVKKVEPVKYAFIAGQGDYSKIGHMFDELFNRLSAKGINPAGAPFAIFYDDPEKVPVEQCRYEIGIPVGVEVSVDTLDTLLQIKELEEMEVASIIHKGPYEKVGSSWETLFTWISRNRYEPAGPGMQVYLNSPKEVPEDSLLTEIRVPVKKK